MNDLWSVTRPARRRQAFRQPFADLKFALQGAALVCPLILFWGRTPIDFN